MSGLAAPAAPFDQQQLNASLDAMRQSIDRLVAGHQLIFCSIDQITTRVIRRGDRIEPYETVRRRKVGGLIDISLTISPVRDAEGKFIGASRIARDITERKRSEAQISILACEAEHRAKNCRQM
jgi:PAS domain-containing protein